MEDVVLQETVSLTLEQLEEAFENSEVKFSQAKMKKLKQLLSDVQPDLLERLEEAFLEFIEEAIQDEWGS